jgi:HSP20 family protein
MALVRWEPGREVDSLQSEVNRVFDAFFGGSAASANRARRWVPPMDLVETEDNLVLRADLPGMKREDVEIEIKDGALTVSGERKAEHEENAEGYYRVERAYGRFSRSLTLPEGIEADAVEANFADGVLEVRIPKPAERKPHRVEINAGAAHANGNGAAPETIEA